MDVYKINFAALLGLCGALFVAQRRSSHAKPKTHEHQNGKEKTASNAGGASQWSFLVVYSLVMGADWLQGPFLYSLYRDEHRVPASLVSTLFTSGFLSGAASGSFIGSLADSRGRKAACLVFCVAYALSCLLTMVPSVPLLFAGRVLGGVSTSLLFSVFESWMVTDFHNRGLEAKGGDLSRTLGTMSTLNSIVAIASGVSSEWLVAATGTRKAPFAASVVLLLAAFGLIWSGWDENYGDAGKKSTKKDQQRDGGVWSIMKNTNVLALGLASTMFEGSMYLFVFFWTPALKSVQTSTGGLPYGIIFASFMASILAASLAFNMIMDSRLLKYSTLLLVILGVANLCFFLLSSSGNRSEQATFWIFCLYEATVGVYWPCMGYLKGRLIDDGIRAQVYSILRIPLNVFVVVSLLLTGDGDAATVFSTCAKLLLASCGALALKFGNSESP